LRSPDPAVAQHAAFRHLLLKEVWGALGGRALWTMLLILCPLVGYSFFQAVALYGEASLAARDSAALASGLSPLDGVLVPSFGALYLGVTLLFPFVAIRTLGREKETGTLRLLVQLPYRVPTLIAAKMTAIGVVWLMAMVPALSTLAIWEMLGGHLSPPETVNLVFGHLLYGLLVGAIALFAAAVSDGAATAAIVTLAFTIGSWVLDFALAGQPGMLGWIAQLSLTQTLRRFEQGLLSFGLMLGICAAIAGFAALAAVWLHPGVPRQTKLVRSIAGVTLLAAALAIANQMTLSVDLAEDRRNSFPAADEQALAALCEPLIVTVRLAAEDPRYIDLRRNVLAKLERTLPHVTIRLATAGQSVVGSTSDESYGEIEYAYGGRSVKTRSTSHREALPLIYQLAGRSIPTPKPGDDYAGYPLATNGQAALFWFLGALPMLIALAWWWTRRAPRIPAVFTEEQGEMS